MSLGPLIRSVEWHYITNTVAVFFHVIAIFFGFYTTEFESLHPEQVLLTYLLNFSLGLITYIAIYNSMKEADTIWVERKSNTIHTSIAYLCLCIKATNEKVPFLLSWISAFTVLLPFLLCVVTLVCKQPPRQSSASHTDSDLVKTDKLGFQELVKSRVEQVSESSASHTDSGLVETNKLGFQGQVRSTIEQAPGSLGLQRLHPQQKKPESISLGPYYAKLMTSNAQSENLNNFLMRSQAVTCGTQSAIRDYFQSCTRKDINFLGRPMRTKYYESS